MQDEGKQLDYDELTLNPVVAEIEPDTCEFDSKHKRRYWAPKEEERFFEIWGRDNWRLTRHGKNTVFFGQWAEELKERWGIDVKSEEVQAKVNQTRAKFRQVKKQVDSDKNTRWKKFDIVEKILKNQYRPEGAEPIPREALERNRDVSPSELLQPSTPSSISVHPDQECLIGQAPLPQGNHSSEQQLGVESKVTTEHGLTNAAYATGDSAPQPGYTVELFTDHIEEVKTTEYDPEIKMENEFQEEYPNYQYQERNHYEAAEESQLHQLQTPQQQIQQLQPQSHDQYATQFQGTPPTAPIVHSQQHLAQHMQQMPLQQQQQIQPQPQLPQQPHPQQQQPHQQQQHQQMQQQQQHQNAYGHSTNSFESPRSLVRSQNHFGNLAAIPPNSSPNAQRTAVVVANSNVASNAVSNNNYAMQPPRVANSNTSQPRKRRASNAITAAVTPAADSIEVVFLEEIRKKNLILEEQTEITRRRLELEQRKVTLMEKFFPKFLELQEQILHKIANT